MGYIRKYYSLTPIFLLILGGCVIHHPDYPLEWAALNISEGDRCVMIAGDYQENGESAEPVTVYRDRKPFLAVPHLSRVLLQYPQTTAQPTRVILSYPDRGVLEVAAYENQNLLAKAQYHEKENTYACEGGVVKILGFRGSPASKGVPMVGYMSDAIYL
jgi:hypothetical protein